MSASGPSGPLVSIVTFLKKCVQEHFESVKWFGSRSVLIWIQTNAKVVSKQQKLLAETKAVTHMSRPRSDVLFWAAFFSVCLQNVLYHMTSRLGVK